MNIESCMLVNNECYKSNARMTPSKLMVHSTACPGVPAQNFISSWNVPRPNGLQVCVHGFIDATRICQTLPWNVQAWHCGGYGNQVAIGIELCEPANYGDVALSKKIIGNAVETYAYLCKTFGIGVNNIISHREGCQMGIASNHGDPDHWWSAIGYTMNNFRNDVQTCINSGKIDIQTGGGGGSVQSASNGGGYTVNFKYQCRTVGGKHYPEVKNLDDCAGVQGQAISALAISCDVGSLWYQVYDLTLKKWLGKVSGYNWQDHNNGYAGIFGHPIGGVRVYYNTPEDLAKKHGYYQKAQYRTSTISMGGYYPWQFDNEVGPGLDGYSGDLVHQIDLFQLY